MGDVYRVSIVRETGSGESYETETLFEVAGGIGMVVRIAPGALVDALRAANEDVPPNELAERVMDSARAAGAPVGPADPFRQDEVKAKRPRRTKAQIAADEEAQAAGYRDAAHRSEVEAQQRAAQPQPEPAPAPAPVEAPTGYMTPDGPVTTAPPATPPAPPAEPYNPFAVS